MADLNNSTPAAETAVTTGAAAPDTQAAAEQSTGTGAEQVAAAKASPIQKLLDALGIGEKRQKAITPVPPTRMTRHSRQPLQARPTPRRS